MFLEYMNIQVLILTISNCKMASGFHITLVLAKYLTLIVSKSAHKTFYKADLRYLKKTNKQTNNKKKLTGKAHCDKNVRHYMTNV